MKRSFLTGLLLFAFIFVSGQIKQDSITVVNRMGPVFQQNGKNLTPGKLLKITESNPEAYSEMKIANNNYVASLFFQIPGGFLVGYPLGTAVGGGDANWTLAGIGAGLIIIGIPLITAYNKHAKNAVNIYNKGLRYSDNQQFEVKVRFTHNGIGVRFNF